MKTKSFKTLSDFEKAQYFWWWWFNGVRTRNDPIIVNIEE